jgi:hypothetical protein
VINKLLAIVFLGLIVGKLLFRTQLRMLARWLDGVVNAFLVAILIAYLIQAVIFFTIH